MAQVNGVDGSVTLTSEDEARAYQFQQDVFMWANSRKDVTLPNGVVVTRAELDAMEYSDRVAFLENVMGANPEDIE